MTDPLHRITELEALCDRKVPHCCPVRGCTNSKKADALPAALAALRRALQVIEDLEPTVGDDGIAVIIEPLTELGGGE